MPQIASPVELEDASIAHLSTILASETQFIGAIAGNGWQAHRHVEITLNVHLVAQIVAPSPSASRSIDEVGIF